MSTVEELIAMARHNEGIARNLFDIEVAIMNIARSAEFLSRLTQLVTEKFSIEYAWIVLTETPSNMQLIEAARGADESFALKTVAMIDFLHATKSEKDPILVNSKLSRLHSLIPAQFKGLVQSMAILPIVVEGKMVGALMLGSDDVERYNPNKDSFFLRQLAVKTSISLAGVWARERISFLATRDPLTLLRNRRELEETLEQELSRHARQREHLAVMFIDCDDFKQVNDTYGHDVGDLYLKHVANQLNELTRKSDLAFRFAGDEFVVLMPHQRQEGADVIAARIKEHLSHTPVRHEGHEIPVAISYGVVSTESMQRVDVRLLLKQADVLLYEMKKQKPNSRSAETLQEFG